MTWILGAAAILAVLFLLAFVCLQAVFGARCEGDPELKYFTHEDFEGLEAEPAVFPSNKGQMLRGAVYTRREVEKLTLTKNPKKTVAIKLTF